MAKFIILGAGAIGRGFLPWIFDLTHTELVFIDTNEKLVKSLRERGCYRTYITRDGQLNSMVVDAHSSYTPTEFNATDHQNAEAIFINVGPRNSIKAAAALQNLTCPVILCENEPLTVDWVKRATQLKKVYFAVPDVITSNTASRNLLQEDPNAIITENGVMFIEKAAGPLSCEFKACTAEEMRHQWTTKLYLHNTPHCVAAYLGALVGAEYLHESMEIPEVDLIVSGTMQEMLSALKMRWDIPHDFLEWYAAKELARFRNKMLFDPISRVAREPLRKLELEGRLLGAAQICLTHGFIPQNLLSGICAAVLFTDAHDSDAHITFMRNSLRTRTLLTYVLGLRKGEVLETILTREFDGIITQLSHLPKYQPEGLINAMGTRVKHSA